tara:strand:- start:103 stop:627 length:525 start_codon:yes stop_codon:yes gene_type:complete
MEDELLLLDNQMNEEIKIIRDKYSEMKSDVKKKYKDKEEYYNTYDPKKLLMARQAYSEYINKPIEEVTNEVVDKTSLGITGWYMEVINKKTNHVFNNKEALYKLIKADISLKTMMNDLLRLETTSSVDEVIQYIEGNQLNLLNVLVNDMALLDMITDMINNKEYNKFNEPEPEI